MNASGVNQYLSPCPERGATRLCVWLSVFDRTVWTDVPVYLDADETAATGRISQQVS
ncbi:MAG: hypothetical protein ACLR6J_11335 [Parabacteroides merdae]